MNNATIDSMHKLGVTESYKLKRQVIVSASEAAEMILRCVSLFALFCWLFVIDVCHLVLMTS